MVSNGYDVDKIVAALRPRVGWKQPPVGSFQVSADNLQADSKRYYDAFHASVTVLKLKEVQDYATISDADYNESLSSLKDDVIREVLDAVFVDPQEIDPITANYDRNICYSDSLIGNEGRFVGYRLKVAKGSYAAQVHSVDFLFNADATFTLYVYHEFKASPVYEMQVSVEANELKEVSLPEWVLSSGNYFVGYYQAELGGAKAVHDDSCRNNFKLIGCQAVNVPAAGIGQIDKVNYSCSDYTYGMSLRMSSYRDFTEEIVQKAFLFDELQGLLMAITVIGKTIHTLRANHTETVANHNLQGSDFLKDDLNNEPLPNLPISPGLRSKYRKEVRRVHETFFPKQRVTVTGPCHDSRKAEAGRRRY